MLLSYGPGRPLVLPQHQRGTASLLSLLSFVCMAKNPGVIY